MNSLKLLSDEELFLRINRLVRSERKIMHLVLTHLQEVEVRKLYLKCDCTSLYQYLTQICGYAENAAYDRIQALRLFNQHPQIAQKIEEGVLKLSQLVKVSSCLKQGLKDGKSISQETTHQILNQIQNKTSFETERILAEEFQLTPQYQERIKPQKDDSIQLQLTLTKDQHEIFQKALSLMSHVNPDQKMADGITFLAKMYLQKLEGKTQKSDQQKHLNNERSNPQYLKNGNHQNQLSTQGFLEKPLFDDRSQLLKRQRKSISVKTKRIVFRRANHSCEYVSSISKRRCCSTYQLQVDHKHPLALGGDESLHNLRLLCAVHNRSEARRLLGST